MQSEWVMEVLPELRYLAPTRRAVRDHLADCGVASADAELMVSELLGNAIVHAGRDITVTVRCATDRTLVEVHDGSPIIPTMRRRDPSHPGGNGLQIVDRLATRWGVDQCAGDGKTVWFELPVDAAQPG